MDFGVPLHRSQGRGIVAIAEKRLNDSLLQENVGLIEALHYRPLYYLHKLFGLREVDDRFNL
jgi:hypothetical protein